MGHQPQIFKLPLYNLGILFGKFEFFAQITTGILEMLKHSNHHLIIREKFLEIDMLRPYNLT